MTRELYPGITCIIKLFKMKGNGVDLAQPLEFTYGGKK
jgi:hypothetical protein